MFRDSEATSENSSSVHIGSNDNVTSQSKVEYMSNGLSVSIRESISNPPPKEANPSTSGQFVTS